MIFDLFRILVETYLQYFNQKSPRIFNRKCFENFMNNYYVAIMPINTVSMLFAKVLRNLYQLSCSISSSSILGPWKSRTQGKLLSTNYASLQLKKKNKASSSTAIIVYAWTCVIFCFQGDDDDDDSTFRNISNPCHRCLLALL